MSEPTPAPDGAPATQTPPAGAPQQPPAAPPDGGGTPEVMSREEANRIIAGRDEAKASNRSLAAQLEAQAEQLKDLQNNQPAVTPAQLEKLAKIEAAEAEAARSKALAAGDADAIATSARKPLEEANQTLRQENESLRRQNSTLLRDDALDAAVRSHEMGPIAPDVVIDALTSRIRTNQVDGQCVLEFAGADGQPLYNADGKVTDVKVFVTEYLKKHPSLCKAKSAPGSGAPAPGAGSATPTTNRTPTVPEWNAMTPEQKDALNLTPQQIVNIGIPPKETSDFFGSG